MDNLSVDELHSIALKIDYDNLPNFTAVNQQFYTLVNSSIFWINKIEHDFTLSVKFEDIKQLREIYNYNATRQHLIIKTSRKSYNTFKDFYLLIINAGLLGESLTNTEKRMTKYVNMANNYHLFFQSDELYNIGISISNPVAEKVDKGKIIGLMIINNRDYLSFGETHLAEETWRELSIIASAIRGKIKPTDLPTNNIDVLQYAVLFDNILVIHQLLSSNPQLNERILQIAATIGTEDTIQLAYDYGARSVTDALLEAIIYHNIYVIDKLLKLGAKITEDITLAAVRNKNVDIIKKIIITEEALYYRD